MNDDVRRDIEALRSFLVDDCIDFPHVIHTALHKAADLIESLSAQLDQVTRERDAAVNSMRGKCTECIHDYPGITHLDGTVCNDCMFNGTAYAPHTDNWQWRGVEKEVEG